MLQTSWTTCSSSNSRSFCSSFCISWNLPSSTLLPCPKTPTHFLRFKPIVASPKPQNHFLGMTLSPSPYITSLYPLWDGDDYYGEDLEIISRETHKICIFPYFLQSWKTKRGKWNAQGHITSYLLSWSWKSKMFSPSFGICWCPLGHSVELDIFSLLCSYRYPGILLNPRPLNLARLAKMATLEHLLLHQEIPEMSSTFRLIPDV